MIRRTALNLAIFAGTAAATAAVTALLLNIHQRKLEARDTVFRVVEIGEDTLDAAVWGRNFPRQYDGWLRTGDTNRTRYGGSEAFSHLDTQPALRTIFAGHAFAADYREERGHMYSLSDQKLTERAQKFKQSGACLHCHAGGMGHVYRSQGGGDLLVGFTNVCRMPLAEAWNLVEHPVTCVDCHDPATMALRISRPALLNGLAVLAATEAPVPSVPSIERWRREGRRGTYDPNREASRQEMRSLVCAQCHVEYYFKGEGRLLTYPWHKGLRAGEILEYYDAMDFADWTHATSGARVVKAQHPEFELWNQGVHARAGVACADCHMPYKREGAMKVSDHHVRSPLLNVARACLPCHHATETEMLERAESVQRRTRAMMDRAMAAVAELIGDIAAARAAGATDEQLATARDLQRKAQWRLDFINAENSMGFHAPAEAVLVLGEAVDFARQGQLTLRGRASAEKATP